MGLAGPPISTTPVTVQTWKPPMDIMTEAAPLKITDQRIGEIAKDLGSIGISGEGMRALRDLGILATGIGAIRMAGGGAAITSVELIRTIQRISKKIDSISEKDDDESLEALAKLSHTLGFLCDKLTKAGAAFAKMIPADIAPPDQNGNTKKSFMPGAVVQNMQINYPVAKPPQ